MGAINSSPEIEPSYHADLLSGLGAGRSRRLWCSLGPSGTDGSLAQPSRVTPAALEEQLCGQQPDRKTAFCSPSAIPTTMPRRRAARSQARTKSTAMPLQRAGQLETKPRWQRQPSQGYWPWTLAIVGGLVLVSGLVSLGVWTATSPSRLQNRAEAAARAGDWATALANWHAVNQTGSATSATHLSEARACLALGRAAQAERSLERAIAADPSNLVPWQLLLKILRVEDRTLEAEKIVWRAYGLIRPNDRPELLRELTLSLLTDLPDEILRTTLKRWVDGDRTDVDAQVALWQRIAVSPRAADPDRPTLVAALDALLSNHPDHVGAREALVAALADAGEPERGRVLLDGWPEPARDARYWRLRGRWNLEYDRRLAQAVAAFQTALAAFPQDWRSWYRLARAQRMLGRDDDGRRAADSVSRIREILDPLTLGPRLDADVSHLADPAALRDLAVLCDRAGLKRLADAWRALADDAALHQALDPMNQQPD